MCQSCNSCGNGLISALENLFGPPCGCNGNGLTGVLNNLFGNGCNGNNFANGFISGVNAANAAGGCGCNGYNGYGINGDAYYAQQYGLYGPSGCGCGSGYSY